MLGQILATLVPLALVSACAYDGLPGLHYTPAQVAQMAAQSGVKDAHFTVTSVTPSGSTPAGSGIVEIRPLHAIRLMGAAPTGKGWLGSGFAYQVESTAYLPMYRDWTPQRYQTISAPSATVLYFDRWSVLPGLAIAGTSGSGLDRAWRLTAGAAAGGKGSPAYEMLVRQRDGVPLRITASVAGWGTEYFFDHVNIGAHITPPPRSSIWPPAPGGDVARVSLPNGGALRILSVNTDYHPASGPFATPDNRLVGIEYMVEPGSSPIAMWDVRTWSLTTADGTRAEPASSGDPYGKGNGGPIALFAVPRGAGGPYTLHAVFGTGIPAAKALQWEGDVRFS